MIFDTDPGVDDAMALLLARASPEVDLLGVTTVFGNNDVSQTTRNALRVLEASGRVEAVPVVAGAGAPLVRPKRAHVSFIHGVDGLGGETPDVEERRPTPWPGGAAGFIVDTVRAHPGEVTLVAVGPLTNLALALALEPRLPSLVKRVVIMGGAVDVPGNATPVGEANIVSDPEAAARVLGAGWQQPVVMVGLDVTLKTQMSAEYLRELAATGTPAAAFVGRITPVYYRFYTEMVGLPGMPNHDPSALAYVLDPSLFRTERVRLHVETLGRCAGQTVPDRRRRNPWADLPEVEVCLGVDSVRLLRLFRERVGG
jgi:inosine-uridine nucleoside N-ribohydrolase